MHTEFVRFVRDYFRRPQAYIPLHEAQTGEEELRFLQDCLSSGQLSSVGPMVEDFESRMAARLGFPHAVATQSGTAALHLALRCIGLQPGELLITQPFCYVAACNAIRYCGAEPVFVDIAPDSLGMSADALQAWLAQETLLREGACYHRRSGRRIRGCMPVYSLGHPPAMDRLSACCRSYGLALVEDAAEALGSSFRGRALGWGEAAILSFNGNKVLTCGGGGMLLTHDPSLAQAARHLSQQARRQEGQQLVYDALGYNYRMPALNAALGLGQLSRLDERLQQLQALHRAYRDFFASFEDVQLHCAPPHALSNYWLQALRFPDEATRDAFVAYAQQAGIGCRPAWTLMTELPLYRHCLRGPLTHAQEAAHCLAFLPSLTTLSTP
jgi:dTDP-4-amino-4,6-dideoxygalactose transaminase